MSQVQKVELTLNIGDEPAALRFSPDATAIVVDNTVITLEGTLQQRQALVYGMARALGMMFVVQGPHPVEVESSPAATDRQRRGKELFESVTSA